MASTAPNAVTPVCGYLDALSNFQIAVIQAINAKFAALQRLAILLEQAANISGYLPNINELPSISAITPQLYIQIAISCPFLHLPLPPPTDAVGKLQAQVDAAYQKLLEALNTNPLNRLGKLQAKMNSFLNDFNQGALEGLDFTHCLQAACQSVSAVVGAASNLNNTSQAVVNAAVSEFNNTFVASGGIILSTVQQKAVNDVNSAKTQINTLRDVPDLPPLNKPPATPTPISAVPFR